MMYSKHSPNKFLYALLAVAIAVILFFIRHATAAEGTYTKFSVDADGGGFKSTGAALGYQQDFFFGAHKIEAGFWTDVSGRTGGAGSLYGSFSIGVEPRIGAFYINLFQGIGVVINPGSRLSGNLQFFGELGLGVRDAKKYSVGLFFERISGAGLMGPEEGRNTVGAKATIPW